MVIEKYYNVKEALTYIKKYPSGREAIEPYMDLSEKQIRDILKKDVLGYYKGLPIGEHIKEDYEMIKNAGIKIKSELRNIGPKTSIFEIYDPNGFLIFIICSFVALDIIS